MAKTHLLFHGGGALLAVFKSSWNCKIIKNKAKLNKGVILNLIQDPLLESSQNLNSFSIPGQAQDN